MAALKGQNLRVFVDGSVVAQATACVITLTNNTQESSTKSDTGLAAKPEVVSKSWQVQVDALDVSDIKTLLSSIKSETVFALKWDQTSTSDNSTSLMDNFEREGEAYISDITFVFNDREVSSKQITFIGSGPIS